MSKILDGLDQHQLAVVTAPIAAIRISAGPGSGKTRVLTRRIAHLCSEGSASPEHVLAVTFSRQAARELTQRLYGLGVGSKTTAGTFHSVALAQLTKHARDNDRKAPEIIRDREKLLRAICTNDQRAIVQSIGNEIDWMQARRISPEKYPTAAPQAQRSPLCGFEEIAEIASKYSLEKRRRRVLDFDDLLARWTDLLAHDKTFAAAQRWRFRHFFVDEMQDLTPRQIELLVELTNGREDVFLVGDPDQSIYSFAGATPELNLSGHFPNVISMSLKYNYRCSPEIVSGANHLASEQRGSASSSAAPITRIMSTPRSDQLVDTLRHLRERGFAWSEIAVLSRNNAQLDRAAKMLASGGVPHSRTREQTATNPTNDLRLATFHASKGLEWPAVVLFDCQTYGDEPEEQRLLYVAMTRAATSLTILNSNLPTRREDWLEGVDWSEPRIPSSSTEPWRSDLHKSKEPLRGVEENLVGAVLDWRDATALSARVAPTTILSDNRARNIAKASPTTVEEIAAIANWGPALTARLGESLLEALAHRDSSSTTGV